MRSKLDSQQKWPLKTPETTEIHSEPSNRQKLQYPIGIFDSGVGGLTVLQAIAKALPNEDLIYFGDTARVPYGNKSAETIVRYSIENAHFLHEKGIKLLVVACNTASAFALPTLREQFDFPIIGVISAGAKKAAEVSKKRRIAILATRATIRSQAYQNTLISLIPNVHLLPIACPLFVPLVEENFISHSACELIVREYLKEIHHHDIDTILLGCTHYPILTSLIQNEAGEHVTLVNSASTCASEVASILQEKNLLNPQNRGTHRYFVSDDIDHFNSLAKNLVL